MLPTKRTTIKSIIALIINFIVIMFVVWLSLFKDERFMIFNIVMICYSVMLSILSIIVLLWKE